MSSDVCGIYKLSIIGDDGLERFYYGRSVNVEKRVREHARLLSHGTHNNERLQRTFNKYGGMTHSVVAVCDECFLAEAEGMFVHTHHGDPLCMNIDLVDPNGAVRISDETRKKHSLRMMGYKPSDETRKKWSEIRRGRKPSKETLEKRSAKLRGLRKSEEWRKKIGDGNRGKVRTQEQKDKLSRPVMLISPTGEQFAFSSILQAAEYLGYSKSTDLCIFLKGRRPWPNGVRPSKLAGWTGHYIDKEADSGN